MGPLHRQESASDVHYTDNNTMSHSAPSIMPETKQSDKVELQNGVILEISSEESHQGIVDKLGGRKGAFHPSTASITETMGKQNGGFVPDRNVQNDDKVLQEINGNVYPDNGGFKKEVSLFDEVPLANQLIQELSSQDKADHAGSIHTTDAGDSGDASTPVKERSRAQSKVSFSDETKVSIFKRMDSIPGEETSFCQKMTSLRWQVALMCCLVASLSITLRQCMSMAIVCMSDQTTGLLTNGSQGNISLFNTSTETSKYRVQWDLNTQGIILSSYYYTFPLTPLLGGYLAGRFGGKHVIFIQMLLMCAASISIPFVAYLDPVFVMIARAVVGFTSGGLTPATVQLLSKWAPRLERSRMLSIVNSGQSIGNILTFLFSGFICMIPLQGGWPFMFYIFTAVNFLGIILWAVLVYDSPEAHPKATVKEITYIMQERRSSSARMPSPPWIKFVTSGPFWAILTAHTTHGFIFTIIGTFLPLYMKDVLKYDPTSNGVLSSLPFIGRFIGSFLVGFIADKCMTKKWFSTGTTRKLLQCIGMLGSAPFLIALSYMTVERRTLAVVLLVCYWTMQSATNAAFRVNHLDIAPTYAGVINGITLTCASLAALAAPIITAAITTNGTREEWQIVFFICVGLGVFGAIIFCILGSGEEQEWAKDPNLDIENDIRRVSMDFQSSTDNSDGLPSAFTLGGTRRKSSQKPLLGVSSDASINGKDNDKDDYTDSRLEKGELSFVTQPTINGISSANTHSFSNIQPVLNSISNIEKRSGLGTIDHSKFTAASSPASPTFSYSSYGFDNIIVDTDEVTVTTHHLDDTTDYTTMHIDEAVEADTYISHCDPTNNTGVSKIESATIMQNKNRKNLFFVLSKNGTRSECTHL